MGRKSKILYMLRPLISLFPEISKPEKRVTFKDKLIWTFISLLIYLISCQIPLYGIIKNTGSDPLYWMRTILASNRGSLMELGISPIITAGMVLQVLAGLKIIEVDQGNREEQLLFNGAQKVVAIIIAMVEGFMYVYTGQYGDIEQIGLGNSVLIVMQLTFSGFLIVMIDEMMNKGYGLGSAISLYIATNVCETIVWNTFSPLTYKSQKGIEYEGSIIALFHSLVTQEDKIGALQQAFYRSHLPNINQLIATVFIYFVVIYFQGFRVDLPFKNAKIRGHVTPYSIKLFYTSNIPIILQASLISNLYFISQMLHKSFKGNFLVRLLGQWQELEQGGIPVSGLVYYVSPIRNFSQIFSDPIHALFYVIFVLTTCAIFSKGWIEISGSSPKDVARQLKEQDMIYAGHRDSSMLNILKRYIPVAASFGGICIGILTILADLMGAIGSGKLLKIIGTGILLAVSIVYGYFETFKKEKEQGTLDLF